MTRSQALGALRRAFVPAVVAGLLVLCAVSLLLLTRAPAYQARVALVAAPTSAASDTAPEFGSVVSLGMPAVPELAVSTPVLRKVQQTAPEVDRAVLEKSVAVELVPASGVARITVTAEDPQTAETILSTVVEEVRGSDLLEPVAGFRLLGDVSERPVQRRPDPLLAFGLATLAACVVVVVTVAGVQVLRPRLLTVDEVQEAVRDEVGHDVPVVAVGRGEPDLPLLLARLDRAAPGARSAVAVAAGDVQDHGLVEALNAGLHDQLARSGANGSAKARNGAASLSQDPAAAVVLVRLRRTSSDELAKALVVARTADRPVGLVLAT